MDPLSVTASILAIVGAATQVTKGLAKVRALHYAPAELSALINEVSDLRAILSQVATFGNQLEEERLRGPVVALRSHLTRARAQLRAVDNLINTELFKVKADGTAKISRTAWIRVKPDVDLAQRELAGVRVNIGTALGVVTSSTMSRVELKIIEISSRLQGQQDMTALLAEIATHLRDHCHTTGGQVPTTGQNTLFPISSIARLQDNQVTQAMVHGPQEPPQDPDTICITAKIRPFGFCKSWCSCCCHGQQSVKFPRAVRSILGNLFVGYSGIPVLTPACNEKSCQKRSPPSMYVSYYFPTWFLSRVLNVTATFTSFKGPQVHLNVPRMVGWVHPLWRHAHLDDVQPIQVLFMNNLASPFDVNAYGQSALHYAALNGRVNCSRFLIEQGADMYLKDENGKKPIDSAWDLALTNRVAPEDRESFMLLYDTGDYVDTRQFSVLHKIVLGIIQTSLESQMDASTACIDDVDANGRTSLSWAAARCDDAAVKTLLDHGANLDISDFEGRTPLAQAVKAAHMPSIELLLRYGANTSKRDAFGGTVLHHACHVKDDPRLLRLLIAAGVDVNAIDYDGDTALQYAVRQKNTENVRCLLESSADPDIANVEGDTPLFMAIFHQANETLRILLTHGVDVKVTNSQRQTVLHAVACEGSLESMQALKSTDLGWLDVLAKDSTGRTCLDYFEARNTSDPAITSAFEEIIALVRQETVEASPPNTETLEEESFADAIEWQT